MWATASPHYKNLKETDLLPLDFIDKIESKRTEEETLKLIEDVEEVKEFWKKLDEKRKNQTE